MNLAAPAANEGREANASQQGRRSLGPWPEFCVFTGRGPVVYTQVDLAEGHVFTVA